MRSRLGPVSSGAFVRLSTTNSTPKAASSHKQTPAAGPNDHSPASAQVLAEGIRKLTPTNTSQTASIEELQLSGTLAPALRRVQAVVARILQRCLSDIQTPPGTPPGSY